MSVKDFGSFIQKERKEKWNYNNLMSVKDFRFFIKKKSLKINLNYLKKTSSSIQNSVQDKPFAPDHLQPKFLKCLL